MYRGLDFDRTELSRAMRAVYDELLEFVATPSFRAVFAEMRGLSRHERPAFVRRVLLSPDELAARGVHVPEGVLIQMSAFGDRRPTLFAVKKFLPAKYHTAWQNLNLTFDQEFVDGEATRDPQLAWRPPLPVVLQNAAMERGVELESLSVA